MKRLIVLSSIVAALAVAAMGQAAATPPASTAGNVCRITHFRTKPGKGGDFMQFRRQNNRPILEEQKKQGLIVSYGFFTKPINEGPGDWDVAQMVCYRNYADAIDPNPDRAAKLDAISLKHYGTAEARTKAQQSTLELRDVISSILIREQILNPMN